MILVVDYVNAVMQFLEKLLKYLGSEFDYC